MAQLGDTIALLGTIGHAWGLTCAAALIVAALTILFGIVSGRGPMAAFLISGAAISGGIVTLCALGSLAMAIGAPRELGYLALAILGLYAIVVSLIGGVIGFTGLAMLRAAGAAGIR
ncbi:MAG: hypothetical protein AAF844_15600 [Pseudomonadota bacterium]